jgi:hypothetical protein
MFLHKNERLSHSHQRKYRRVYKSCMIKRFKQVKRVQTSSNGFKRVQTSSNWFKQVQTGSNKFKRVQTGLGRFPKREVGDFPSLATLRAIRMETLSISDWEGVSLSRHRSEHLKEQKIYIWNYGLLLNTCFKKPHYSSSYKRKI